MICLGIKMISSAFFLISTSIFFKDNKIAQSVQLKNLKNIAEGFQTKSLEL